MTYDDTITNRSYKKRYAHLSADQIETMLAFNAERLVRAKMKQHADALAKDHKRILLIHDSVKRVLTGESVKAVAAEIGTTREQLSMEIKKFLGD